MPDRRDFEHGSLCRYNLSGIQNEKDEFIEFAIAYCPVIEGLESGLFRQVLVHEAVGHGFGKLEDEYVYMERGMYQLWKCRR